MISFIIPTFSTANLLKATLDSLYATVGGRLEVFTRVPYASLFS